MNYLIKQIQKKNQQKAHFISITAKKKQESIQHTSYQTMPAASDRHRHQRQKYLMKYAVGWTTSVGSLATSIAVRLPFVNNKMHSFSPKLIRLNRLYEYLLQKKLRR